MIGEEASQLIVDRFMALGLFVLWGLFAIHVARSKSFFSLPYRSLEAPSISLVQTIAVFVGYLSAYLLIGPLVQRLLQNFSPELHRAIASGGIYAEGWLYLGLTFCALCLVNLLGFVAGPKGFLNIWGMPRYSWKLWKEDLRLGSLSWLIAFPVVGLVSQFVGLLILLLHGPFEAEQAAILYVKKTMPYPFLFSWTIFSVVIMTPLLEELLFRGFLQSWLRRHFSSTKSIVCTSIIFAAFHYSPEQGWSNWELVPALFALACFLGYLFEKQRSIWASFGLHATFNAFGILFLTLAPNS